MHIPSITAASVLLMQMVSLAAAERSWDDAYALAKPLVKKMTIKQKVGVSTGKTFGDSLCVGNTFENSHFGSLCMQDGPLSVRLAYNVTAGVAGVTASASFDKDAIRQRGEMMGEEFRGKGVNVQLGPAMNFMRSPEGGRGWESFGECEFLTGVAASETIKGIQSKGVIATAKHYILNDQETNRMNSSVSADDRTLHEIYLWPFARSVEAGVGAIMCSYNLVNGTHACEDDHTLNKILKDELDFKGFVMSDWWGTHSTAKAANNGLDMEMPGTGFFGDQLIQAVNNGSVPETRLDDMTTRIVAAWFKMEQDKGFPKTTLTGQTMNATGSINVRKNHPGMARALAAGATVLLKNEDEALPLSSKDNSISIIGSDAFFDPLMNDVKNCPYYGCDPATLVQGWGSGSTTYVDVIAPVDGLKARAGKNVKFHTYRDNWDLKGAKEVAEQGKIAIVFANADSGEEIGTGSGTSGVTGDRHNLTLWNNGDNLIQTVADANKNTIVVVHSVGAVLMPWADHPNIKAIVYPGLPGEQSGNALADILYGDVNPSGRLPYTIAKKASDYPAKISSAASYSYTEKLLMGFKWFDAKKIEPQFPFGFGLSYTSFDYGKFKVHANAKKSQIKASVQVKNTGKVAGAEIVQLYVSFPKSAGEPPKLLRGFEKVMIKPGHKETVNFELGKTELSIWDVASQKWVIPHGQFTLHIGASSRDLKQSVSFSF